MPPKKVAAPAVSKAKAKAAEKEQKKQAKTNKAASKGK